MRRRGIKRPRRNHTKSVRYLSILDMGTWAVKALVVELQEDQVTIVGRGQARHPKDWGGDDGVARDALAGDRDALGIACEEALSRAEDATEVTKGRKVVPDAAMIAVPTAWLHGALGSGSVERSALETSIAQEECYEPLARAGRHALRNLGRVTGPGKWELLDATLVTFGVNGNPVTDPVGFRGYSLAATVFVVAAPDSYLNALRQIADFLQLNPPHLVAEPLALAAAVADDGLIVQVGASTTGLTLTRHGTPLALDSIRRAGATWTRALSDTFHLSLPRAEALKRAHSAGKLGSRNVSAVQKALEAPLTAWTSALIERLQSWDKQLTWSPIIHLCGGASALPDVQATVSKTRWLDALPFPYTPETRLWDGSRLSQVTDRTQPRWQLDGVTTLALAAWAVRNRGPETADGMLRAALAMQQVPDA